MAFEIVPPRAVQVTSIVRTVAPVGRNLVAGIGGIQLVHLPNVSVHFLVVREAEIRTANRAWNRREVICSDVLAVRNW